MTATKNFNSKKDMLLDVIVTTCANCYNETNKRIHVGSIEGFIFCSQQCALNAMRRHFNQA
jgi:hypothetical protein